MYLKYGVVIPARNEGENIRYVLKSLLRQSIKPYKIVVVDDSSDDDTEQVARENGSWVVSIRRRSNAYATGHPYLAYVFNKGFESVEDDPIEYVLVSGAECIYPEKYMGKIMMRMETDHDVVIASGIAAGEFSHELGVRGGGRVIDTEWFKKIGFRYPLNYGFESWLLYKALSMGYKIKLYNDIKFYIRRRTRMNPGTHFLEY